MIFARSALLAAIAAMAFVTLGALAAPAQESDPVELRIEVYGFAGFHVLTNRTRVAATGAVSWAAARDRSVTTGTPRGSTHVADTPHHGQTLAEADLPCPAI